MSENLSLREYQENLRSRMDAVKSQDASSKVVLLGFLSGDKHYLIDGTDVVDVHHVTPMEPIPLAKPWAIGVANIKGSVYSITDFSALIDSLPSKRNVGSLQRGKYLILSQDIISGAALYIDSLTGLFDLNDVGELNTGVEAGMPEWIDGHHLVGHRYFLVDAAKLAVDTRFSKLQSGES